MKSVLIVLVICLLIDLIGRTCNKCKKTMNEMQVQEPKIDETELLDNLLTICEGDNKGHPILSNKNKCNGFAEMVYVMSTYENMCTLVGVCEDSRENSVLPFEIIPEYDCSQCAGLAADAAHKCACTKECTPECIQAFELTVTRCTECFVIKA